MTKTAPAKTVQKLAQKLRENLKRRKAQTRQRNLAQSAAGDGKVENPEKT